MYDDNKTGKKTKGKRVEKFIGSLEGKGRMTRGKADTEKPREL